MTEGSRYQVRKNNPFCTSHQTDCFTLCFAEIDYHYHYIVHYARLVHSSIWCFVCRLRNTMYTIFCSLCCAIDSHPSGRVGRQNDKRAKWVYVECRIYIYDHNEGLLSACIILTSNCRLCALIKGNQLAHTALSTHLTCTRYTAVISILLYWLTCSCVCVWCVWRIIHNFLQLTIYNTLLFRFRLIDIRWHSNARFTASLDCCRSYVLSSTTINTL